jgi:2-dehydro-3-deoxygluconokinase
MPHTRSLHVITCGEAMALLIAQQTGPLDEVHSFTRATAGAELNVAIGLARLGLQVGYISRVGDDSWGRYLLATLAHEGISRDWVRVDAHYPTGFMLKSLTLDGSDPSIEYHRKGSAASHMDLSDLPAPDAPVARHVHLTGISPALSPSVRELIIHLAQSARTHGQTVSFDPNLRPRLWPSQEEMITTLNALAQHADWVLPGLAEGRLLTGQTTPEGIADFYLRQGAKAVVIKLGAAGAFYADGDVSATVAGVPAPHVVDTVGAGDGFAVGVISARLEGLSWPEAVARGNQIGARVVQFPGDCDGLPTRAQLISG